MTLDGKRMLLKGNRKFHSQESLNEVIASKLHEKQGFQNYVVYEPYALDDGQYGCVCEDFATSRLEFIPAIDVVESEKKDNAVSMYEHFIAMCMRWGLAEEHAVKLERLLEVEEIRKIYELDPMIVYVDAVLQGYQKKIDILSQYQKK